MDTSSLGLGGQGCEGRSQESAVPKTTDMQRAVMARRRSSKNLLFEQASKHCNTTAFTTYMHHGTLFPNDLATTGHRSLISQLGLLKNAQQTAMDDMIETLTSRYIKGTPCNTIIYVRPTIKATDTTPDIAAHVDSDSDWAGCATTRQATAGFIIKQQPNSAAAHLTPEQQKHSTSATFTRSTQCQKD